GRHDHRILQAGLRLARGEAILVRLGVDEFEGIGGGEARVVLNPGTVEQDPQPLGCADPEVMSTLGTYAEVGREVLVVDRLGATRTLDPQALRYPARVLLARGGRLAGLLQPRHSQ